MQDDQKNKAKLLRELNALRSRVTELTQAQEKLKQYRFIVEAVHDAIFFKDLESRYIIANNKTLEAFGLSREQVIGKNDYEIMENQDEARKNIKDDNLVFKTGKLTEITKRMTGADGKERWFQAIKVPKFDNDGKIIGLIGIAHDITEQKKVDKSLRESEERYRDLIEKEKDIIYTLDKIGNITFASPAVETMLGFRAEELIGKHFTILIPKEWQERTMADFNNLLKTGETTTETVLLDKKRQFHFVEYSSTVIKEGNKVMGTRGIVRDISERKKAQEQIKKLILAIEQSIDGIAVGDLEPKLLYVNDAFARMHGYTPEEMVGMPVTKLHNKLQMQEHRRYIKQLKTKGFWEGEIGHIRKDGTAFLTYTTVTLLKNNDGKPTGTLAVARDITESKRTKEELNIYKEKMARAEELASVGTLSASLAHELTQPLTVIRLSIQNSLAELETMSCPGTVVEDLKEGLSEVSTMTSMVDRFRNFAKMSSTRTVSEVDLKAITERIVELLDENSWRAKVTLKVEGMDKLPLIYSYERDLEQLFFSLVENAIQAADGKKNRQVIISGAVRDENIELQFSDNCGGIAPENLDRIFEPFFTTKHADKRTGLGLCVVERIVSQLGGKIRIESKLGKGSTFFITLPINKRKEVTK